MADAAPATGSASASTARRDARAVVVGAGIGGLVAALLLACRGVAVTLVEAADAPGGKMRRVCVGGAPIDAGPTVFTMRWVFDELLAEAGSSLDALVGLQPLPVLARHAWRPGADGAPQRLDLHADLDASLDAIAAFSGAAEARRYAAFCAEARRIHDVLVAPHIAAQRPTLASMTRGLGPRGLAALASLGPFASLWTRLGRHFHDPRLRQLFGRYATYCGSSPWQAPATLMLIAHVEQSGVWSVDGGMHALPVAIARLAAARGVALHYGRRCHRIVVEDGRACGVQLDDGRVLPADAVVFNGDANALATGLLGSDVAHAVPALPRRRRSLSALTWALHTRAGGMALDRHNVFFGDDYAAEFDDLFRARRLPRDPTVYVCAQDRGAPAAGAAAPAGERPERLLCLVNAPADGDRSGADADQPGEIERCLSRSLDLLHACGLTLAPTPAERQTTSPSRFETMFPATGGALYGTASHGWTAVFRRPGAATRLPGLVLAGGSAHPGPGVPMAAMSGRLAAATVLAALDSTSRSRAAATAGGTSTRSATTAGTG